MSQEYRGNKSREELLDENIALIRESIERVETLIAQTKRVLDELVGNNGLTPEVVRRKIEERRNDRVMTIYNALLKCLYEEEELDGYISIRFGSYYKTVQFYSEENFNDPGEFKCSSKEFEKLLSKLRQAEIFEVSYDEENNNCVHVSMVQFDWR